MNNIKVYVEVEANFDREGNILPKTIKWEDGRTYEIDKVFSVFPAVARRAGGQGDCFAIRINGQESRLYFERSTSIRGVNLGRWFVERKV